MNRRAFLAMLTAAAASGLGVSKTPAIAAPPAPVIPPAGLWTPARVRYLVLDSRCELWRDAFLNHYVPLWRDMDGRMEVMAAHPVWAGDTIAVRIALAEWSFTFSGIVTSTSLQSSRSDDNVTEIHFVVLQNNPDPDEAAHRFEVRA